MKRSGTDKAIITPILKNNAGAINLLLSNMSCDYSKKKKKNKYA